MVNRALVFIVNTPTLLISEDLVMTEDNIIIYSDAGFGIVDGCERLSALFESCTKLECVVCRDASTVKISW